MLLTYMFCNYICCVILGVLQQGIAKTTTIFTKKLGDTKLNNANLTAYKILTQKDFLKIVKYNWMCLYILYIQYIFFEIANQYTDTQIKQSYEC